MDISVSSEKLKLPDFLIVGAAKSGTTSIYNYLKEHPEIFLPDKKEPWFFSFMDDPQNFESPDPLNGIVSDISEYEKLFEPASDKQIIGEASPSYLYTYKTAIENIKEVYGEKHKKLKIVIMLRNPADRAFSQYMHFKENLQEPLSFWQAIDPETIRKRLNNNWNIFYDYIGFGMYYKQVEAYLNAFEQVKIISFEDFKNNTEQVVKDLIQFLGANENILPSNVNKKYNVSRVIRTDTLSPIYRFLLFGDNKIKKSLANMLPEKARDKLEKMIRKILSKRKKLSKKEKEKLMSVFREDYTKLDELLSKL